MPMKLLLPATLVLIAAATPAAAREYPICLSHVQGRMGAVERCDFTTIEQCRVASLGLQGSCSLNWRYTPPRNERRKRTPDGY